MTALSWISFFSALLPLGFLLAMRLDVGAEFWIVGVAWVLAVGSDAQALLDGGTWVNTHVWPLAGFALLARAFVDDDLRWWGLVGVLAFAAWAGVRGGMDGPEMLVPALGSIVVLAHVSGPLTASMVAYCGVGTALYIGYALTVEWYAVATVFWACYKVATLVSFGLFGRAAWRMR